MVRTYKRITTRGSYGTTALQNALDQILNGMPVFHASKEFGIPARTLRRHRDKVVKEPGSMKLGRFRNVLPDAVEMELKGHILEMEKRLYGLTFKDIQKLAYDLADKMGIKHPFNKCRNLAGKDWVRRFLSRHGLVLRQPEGTSMSRAAGFNRGQVSHFFDMYKQLLETYNFPPSRIWNADETGLTTVQSLQKVVTQKGSRSVGKITSAERGSLVTMLCACNALGCFVPPMYIFRRKRMVGTLMAGAPPQSVGFPSDSGWIDQELFLKWLEHFSKIANPSPDSPHLIILDGHHSHKTLAAVEYCRSKGIILITLPPHSTHKMQPLDRAYFKSLKAAFNCEADKFMVSNLGRRITVYDMAKLTGTAYMKTALPEKAVNGFKSCGLWPFDSNVFSTEDFDAVLQFDLSEEENQNTHFDDAPSAASSVSANNASATSASVTNAAPNSASTIRATVTNSSATNPSGTSSSATSIWANTASATCISTNDSSTRISATSASATSASATSASVTCDSTTSVSVTCASSIIVSATGESTTSASVTSTSTTRAPATSASITSASASKAPATSASPTNASAATHAFSPIKSNVEPDTSATVITTDLPLINEDDDTVPGNVINGFQLIPTLGDGRCLFRSLVIGMNRKLQTCERDSNGKLDNPLLDMIEQISADELRTKVISYMCDNIDSFDHIQGDAINADLPSYIRYSSLQDRIIRMANPLSMPGEIELVSASKAIMRPIYVLDTRHRPLSAYGDNDGLQSDPLYVQFSRIRDDVGHYDCLIKENKELNKRDCYVTKEKITNIIHKISPVPKLKRSSQKKSAKKQESAEVITSSPYKRVLEAKEGKRGKRQKRKPVRNERKNKKKSKTCVKKASGGEDWPCIICCDVYSNTRPGEVWVECQVCHDWAHEDCTQGLPQFVCPNCESDM